MNTQTTELIVVKSSLGRPIQEFQTVKDAVEWAQKRRNTFKKQAPEMTIVRTLIIKEEEVIAHV